MHVNMILASMFGLAFAVLRVSLDGKHLRSNASHLDGVQDRRVVATTDIRTEANLVSRAISDSKSRSDEHAEP